MTNYIGNMSNKVMYTRLVSTDVPAKYLIALKQLKNKNKYEQIYSNDTY